MSRRPSAELQPFLVSFVRWKCFGLIDTRLRFRVYVAVVWLEEKHREERRKIGFNFTSPLPAYLLFMRSSFSPCEFVISVRAQQVGQMIPRFSLNEMMDDCRPFIVALFDAGDCHGIKVRREKEERKNRSDRKNFHFHIRIDDDNKLYIFIHALWRTFSFSSRMWRISASSWCLIRGSSVR